MRNTFTKICRTVLLSGTFLLSSCIHDEYALPEFVQGQYNVTYVIDNGGGDVQEHRCIMTMLKTCSTRVMLALTEGEFPAKSEFDRILEVEQVILKGTPEVINASGMSTTAHYTTSDGNTSKLPLTLTGNILRRDLPDVSSTASSDKRYMVDIEARLLSADGEITIVIRNE